MKRLVCLLLLLVLSVGCAKAPVTAVSPVSPNFVARYATDGLGVVRTFDFNFERAQMQKAARQHHSYSTRALATQADLRSTCTPVGDQGKLGACTAWALGKGLREQLEKKRTGNTTLLSPLFLYYAEREMQGTANTDSGATVTDAVYALSEKGICPETDWPYLPERFNVKPSDQAAKDALLYKVKSTKALDSLDDIKRELSKGHTVAFGFRVFQSFLDPKVAKTGQMTMPVKGEKVVGGHAALFVGFDDAKGVFIVRNSYGPNWGDEGYFYMPYDFAAQYATDFWTAY